MSEWRCGPKCPFCQDLSWPYGYRCGLDVNDGATAQGEDCLFDLAYLEMVLGWTEEDVASAQEQADRLRTLIAARKAQEPPE